MKPTPDSPDSRALAQLRFCCVEAPRGYSRGPRASEDEAAACLPDIRRRIVGPGVRCCECIPPTCCDRFRAVEGDACVFQRARSFRLVAPAKLQPSAAARFCCIYRIRTCCASARWTVSASPLLYFAEHNKWRAFGPDRTGAHSRALSPNRASREEGARWTRVRRSGTCRAYRGRAGKTEATGVVSRGRG